MRPEEAAVQRGLVAQFPGEQEHPGGLGQGHLAQ
jgi:hypothetical protein